jgi:Cytochrome P450
MVSVSDPAAITQIYGFTGKFKKSDFYSVILPMSKGRILPGLFATQDEGIHSMLKKPIASIYSMSNLVSFEPYVDATMGYFCEQLDKRFAEPGKICDFSTWLQFFAFDVVGEITFYKRLGFLERGEDVENIMGDIWKFFQYVAPTGQMPWLDRLWVKNPIISRMRPPGWNAMAAFALARQKERDEVEKFGNPEAARNQSDFLSRFLAAKQKDPSIPDWAILAWTQSNITAGSDTTAIFLRTLFYNLLRYPDTLQKIMTELIEAKGNGELNELASWHQTRSLPYLDACIKEAGRIHPPFGLPLERVVPPEGATICGQFLKGGTIVGMNAWVVHRDQELFGEDADKWNPGRWFCDEEKRKAMDRGLLTVSSHALSRFPLLPVETWILWLTTLFNPSSSVRAIDRVSGRTFRILRSTSSFQRSCRDMR